MANKLKINTSRICGFIQIKQKLYSQSILELHNISKKFKHDMDNLSIRILSYEQQNSIEMILLNKKDSNKIESSILFNEITDIASRVATQSDMVAIIILDILGLEELYEEYKYVKKTGDVVQKVYPYKKNLSKYDVRFAGHCLNLISTQNGEVNKFKEILKSLLEYDSTHGSNIVETLAVYVLDTGLNTQQTAKILFLHPNTVKYRIKKIESIFRNNITYTPLLPMLSIALGIYRLSINDKNLNE